MPNIVTGRPTDPPGDGASKAQWRQWARGLRQPSSEESLAAMALLVPNLPANGWVVVYDPLPDELDPTSLVDAIGVGRVALTRTPDVGLNLTIHPIDGPKEQHRYGYLQPAADSPMIADDAIAAIAVPALAFDRRGYRLGRGKGYYDCTLARLSPSCHRIGVVAANRVVNQLPYEPHDVAMTAVCTSSEFFSLR